MTRRRSNFLDDLSDLNADFRFAPEAFEPFFFPAIAQPRFRGELPLDGGGGVGRSGVARPPVRGCDGFGVGREMGFDWPGIALLPVAALGARRRRRRRTIRRRSAPFDDLAFADRSRAVRSRRGSRFVLRHHLLQSVITTNVDSAPMPTTQPTSAIQLNVSVALRHRPPACSPSGFCRMPSRHCSS